MLLNISIIAILLSKVMPCDCAPPPSPEEAYEMADAVFSGEVISIVEDWDNLLKEISIDVYDVWKGSIDNQIVILTGIDDGICGYNFQEGLEYLIYANLSGQNLWTNICTRTTLLEDAEEDLEYLNQLLPCDNGYTEYDGECYYNDDLNFLTLLIYLNDIEFELYYDIGLTIWQNGRINTLLLEGMAIHEIPNNIQNLDSLVHLSFSDNELEYLPDAIGNLPSLNSLFLSNNLLIEIPEAIGDLTNLEFFHLSGNQLEALPSTISHLSSLISLNIDNNLFTNFPTGLIDLNNLQYLYMANNAINNLPSNIGILSSLQIFSAYTNDISQIPSSIGSLSNLYHFDVTNNDLTAIPETICDIYANLTVLNIGLNYICSPYPECLTDEDIGEQDTSECNEPDPEYDIELHIQNFEEDGTFELILVNNTDLVAFEFDIPGLSEPDWDFSDNFPTDGWMWAGYWLFYNLYNTPLPVGIYEINASGDLFNNEFCVDGSVFSNSTGEQITNVFFSECAFVECSNPGDINYDGAVDILDIVGFVNDILNPWISNELFHVCGDINEDDEYNVLDIVLLIDMILNPQPSEECNVIPEVGPCDGICPTYYYNQDTNQCEEFITGCCGVEAFDTMEDCLDICEQF